MEVQIGRVGRQHVEAVLPDPRLLPVGAPQLGRRGGVAQVLLRAGVPLEDVLAEARHYEGAVAIPKLLRDLEGHGLVGQREYDHAGASVIGALLATSVECVPFRIPRDIASHTCGTNRSLRALARHELR